MALVVLVMGQKISLVIYRFSTNMGPRRPTKDRKLQLNCELELAIELAVGLLNLPNDGTSGIFVKVE